MVWSIMKIKFGEWIFNYRELSILYWNEACCQGVDRRYMQMKGCFGKPIENMKPGERYRVGFRGFGKIYLAKVDTIV